LIAKAKTPSVAELGVFYTVLNRWFIPEAGYRLLLIFVQPFADVVGNYTCQNRENKG
jgi:hypothetical protein